MTTEQNKRQKIGEAGMIMVTIIGIMIFLGIILIGMFGLATGNLLRAKGRVLSLQAQYSAESGADAAIGILNSGNDTYTGTSSDVQVLSTNTYKATYSVSVAAGVDNKEKILTATGKVYSPKTASTPKFKRVIRVTTQRSATTTGSAVLSRNILALDSGVKNLFAKDLSVNSYISTAKNTTNIVAENITVAGRLVDANNCSILGTGNLVKPSSFTTPGQTKTNITTAYNNCISPPGNSSNSNFTVNANQGNIATVQSTYIPWSQYMDNGYTAATNGCNDWASSATPREIPSTNASKKTHYPDTASNISASCGSSGDISMGTTRFNINANAHIRANLCAATACNPSFYNPDSTIKYIFVEGSINFDSVQTVSGSGPIAFIVYGADPASKTSLCPYGGAFYLGNSGSSSARALYVLATNGICLDKTKFSTSPAFGGIGGKNIYIATNSGSPFDLNLDPAFPVSQIPTDLAWRAVRYQRL